MVDSIKKGTGDDKKKRRDIKTFPKSQNPTGDNPVVPITQGVKDDIKAEQQVEKLQNFGDEGAKNGAFNPAKRKRKKKKIQFNEEKKDSAQELSPIYLQNEADAKTDEFSAEPLPEMTGENAVVKKKKRRRRRKKKKNFFPQEGEQNISGENQKEKVEKTAEEAVNKIVPKETPIEQGKADDFGQDLSSPPREETKIPEDNLLPQNEEKIEGEGIEVKKQEESKTEEKIEEKKDESSVWDQYDENKPADVQENKAENLIVPQEEKKEDQKEADIDTETEENDVPDWLKDVPQNNWQDDKEDSSRENVSPQIEEKYASDFGGEKSQEVEIQHEISSAPSEFSNEEKSEESSLIEQSVENNENMVVTEEKESFLKKIPWKFFIRLTILLAGVAVLAFGIYFFVTNVSHWYSTIKEAFWTNKQAIIEEKPVESPKVKVEEDFLPKRMENQDSGVRIGEKLGYYLEGEGLVYPGQRPRETETEGEGFSKENLDNSIKSDLKEMVLTLREMKNLFEADIYGIMDRSTNRYTSLISHINLMILLEETAKKNMLLLQAQIDYLKEEFDKVTAEKDQIEKAFFADIKALNPNSTEQNLIDFLAIGQKQFEIKARYNARRKILNYHSLLLDNLAKRRRDYELNKDALVKGVKVIDVKGSDINLILQDTE